jgi:hypothetical protein
VGRTVQNQGYKIRKMYKKTLPVDTALGGLATPIFIFILRGNVPYFYVSLVGPISTLVAELVIFGKYVLTRFIGQQRNH